MALIGFIRFINNGGDAKSIASRSMGNERYVQVGCQRAQKKKSSAFWTHQRQLCGAEVPITINGRQLAGAACGSR